jgi:hypothetical protein
MTSNSTKPNTLLDLIKLPDKRAVEKFCRDAIVTMEELSDFIWAAKFGDLAPYQYACHFEQLVPEHLLPTDSDNGALAANGTGKMGPDAQKFVRKVGQLFKDRRVFSAHLLYEPTKTYWHLICFDQRDMDITSNHWKKGGSHVHYSRECYVNDNLDNVWARVCGRPPKPPSSEHIRFTDPRERAFVGPGDTA